MARTYSDDGFEFIHLAGLPKENSWACVFYAEESLSGKRRQGPKSEQDAIEMDRETIDEVWSILEESKPGFSNIAARKLSTGNENP